MQQIKNCAGIQFFLTQELYNETPTTRFHTDQALLLTELF